MSDKLTLFLKIVATAVIALLAIVGSRYYITGLLNDSNDWVVWDVSIVVFVLLVVVGGTMKALWWPAPKDEPWPPADQDPQRKKPE